MKTMKHSGKKILSVFLAVLMVMTAWVFVAPTEAEAASKTVALSALAAIHNGSGDRSNYDRIVICSDGEAGNTTVGNAKFNMASIPENASKVTFNLSTGNHGGSLVSGASVKVFLIDPSKCQATDINQAINNIANIYGGDYNSEQGVTNAYNYYDVTESQALYTFSQNSSSHSFDITDAVNTARAKGWSDLCFAFIMPDIYNDNNSNTWSDTHINVSGTNLVCEYEPVGQYYIRYVVNVTNTGDEKDNNLFVSYRTNNGQGELVTNETLFDGGNFDWNGNNYVIYEGYIDGFPTELHHHFAFSTNTADERHENFRLYVGKDANSLSSNSILATSGNNWTYNNKNQDNHMPVVSGTPYQNSISGMSSLSFTVGKNGQGQSSVTTGTVYDQYGVQWYQAPTYAVSSSSTSQVNVSGISAVASGRGAYVKVTDPSGVFKSEYGYNPSTGKVTLYLRATSGGASASVPITITAPQYNAYLNYYSGANAKTYSNIGYYNQSVILSDFPANSTPTQLTGNAQQHQTYTWPANATQAFYITSDTTFPEVKGTLADHNFDKNSNGSVDVGDYTITDGNHSLTCADCGYTKTQTHQKGTTGYVTKEETCTEDGIMTYDCSVCGKKAIETSEINNITGHNFAGSAVENVTGENGNHWKKCSRCNVCGWGTTENAYENHNWDKNSDGIVDASDAIETKASTCKEAGYEKYKCTVCSATWTKTLDLATHTITATAKKDVTNVCGGDGNAAFWSCSVCDRVWKDAALTEEISNVDADNDGIPDAAETKGPDHEFTGAYVSVSGGEDGTHHRQCTRFTQCKTYGPEEKHTWGDPAVTPATCEKEGKKVYTCTSGCGQTYEETIEKATHQMTKIPAVAAACGKPGNNEYYSCSTCGKYYKDAEGTKKTTVSDETIPALEHTWTSHHDYDTLKEDATCQKAAVYNNHCDYCKVKMTGATHPYGAPDTVNGHQFNGEIKKNDDGTHSYACTVAGCQEYGNATNCEFTVLVKDVASTCHTVGYTIYKCATCGKEKRVEKTSYDFTNHAGGTEVRDIIETKCNSNGFTGNTYCLGCRAIIKNGTTITADPSVHPHEDMKDYAKVDSTCQNDGWKAYRYCSACGTYEIAKETIAKKAHKFTTYTSNGDGTHTATCDTCKADVAEPVTDTKDCSGGTANCVDEAVCTVCGGKYGEVDSANHKTVITVKKKDSTCQTEGYEAYRKCEACNVDIDPITPIAKKDHVYGLWSTNNDGTHSRSCTTCDATVANVAKETADCSGGVATCIARAKCAVCKAEYGEINIANHATQAATLKNAKEASCTEEGYTGDRHYDCCDAIKENGTTIPKLDHKYTVALENTKVASTCTEKGSIKYKCETCDATEEKELELNPQNHSSEETIVVNDKAATCESDGYTGDTYHKCCYKPGGSTAENRYALISKGSVIKANGQHVYSDAVPEYMIKKIVEEKDAEGNVTSRSFDLKDEEPAYAEKIGYRHDDNYWYHKQICTICYEVVETRCYTYPDHQADCVNTDSCFVCKGLCSLTNPDKHTLKEIEKISATCEKNGRKAYYVCEACGKEFFDLAGKNEITDENKSQLVIPSTMKHTIDRDETPIADNKGNHTYSCSVCGTAIVEACSGGEATCKDKAKCEYCGVEYGELNKNKHVKGTTIVESQEPYKCKPGVSGKTVYICCPDVVVYEGDIIPATEPHDWKETTDKADNCANGYTITKTCNYCGEVEITEVAAGTHDLSVVVYETEKDCKKERTIYYACSICGFTDKEVEIDGVTYKYIFAEVIEAKEDCTWTSWTYEQKPSCVVEGKKTRKCLACGKTEEEILPKTDHTIKTEAGYAATCDKAGKQDYVYCVIEGCPYAKGGAPIGQLAGYEKYKDCNGKVIEALGHGDHNGDDYCDHCGGFLHENEDGTNCNCICHKRHWFMRIIYKILRFFWKLFGISRTCCSAGVHY